MNSNQRRQKQRKNLRDWPVGAEVLFQFGYTRIRGSIVSHQPHYLNTCKCKFEVGGTEYERHIPICDLKPA